MAESEYVVSAEHVSIAVITAQIFFCVIAMMNMAVNENDVNEHDLDLHQVQWHDRFRMSMNQVTNLICTKT